MILQKGIPSDLENREAKEIEAYRFLDELGVVYERIDHAPAMTMEICAEIDKVLGAMICKNLFLCNRQQTDYYLLMMPSDKAFKTKDLSAQIGSSRLSFASAEAMGELLNVTPGSVSVFGLIFDREKRVRLLIDKDIISSDFIGCHPCVNTSSLRIGTQDMLKRIIPRLGYEPQIVEL